MFLEIFNEIFYFYFYINNSMSKIFIIMTAYNSPQVLEKAREYKCEILNKPFEDLRAAMKKIEGGE